MISKELLSKVLGYKQPDVIKLYGKTDVTLVFGDDMVSINIYELAHKCKEWAKRTGFMIESDNMNEARVYPTDENGWILKKEIEFLEDSEPEAVFKACEWILKKTK